MDLIKSLNTQTPISLSKNPPKKNPLIDRPTISFPPTLLTNLQKTKTSLSSSSRKNNDNNISTRTNGGDDTVLIAPTPTMSEILDASKSQNLGLELRTLGPFFRVTAKSLETGEEIGKAEGMIRVWWKKGKILHLDSIKLRREALRMEKSIFGIGLFLGAVAVRYGCDCGCKTAELLAINDSQLYHSKLVRFYTRIGFKVVYEVMGSSMGDLPHMLVWGGVGTRMDADINYLLIKWCSRFSPRARRAD